MDLGEKIIRIREENNLTQEEMAARIYVTRQAVSKWERGLAYPSLDVLRLISREFQVSMNELLGVGESSKSKEYKAIGFKHPAFALIYGAMFLFVGGVDAAFNAVSIGSHVELWELVFYNLVLFFVLACVASQFVKSLFPIGRVLLEYNDFGLRLKTLTGSKTIPFEKIVSLEVKTHGNWNAGRLTVRTFEENYAVYPLKDLNQVKTVIDEVRLLNRY